MIIKFSFNKEKIKETIEYKSFCSFLLVIAALLFIFRTAIPSFKYPFIVLMVVNWSITISYFRKILVKNLQYFFKTYKTTILLVFIMIVAFYASSKMFMVMLKDLINTIIILSFFLQFQIFSDSTQQLKILKKNILQTALIFAYLICFNKIMGNPLIFSLNIQKGIHLDTNFALVPIFFGFIITLNQLTNKKRLVYKVLYNSLLFIFTFHIISSSSRRGIALLLLIILFLSVIQIISWIKPYSLFKKNKNNFLIYLTTFFFISTTFFVFAFHASYNTKNKALELLGSKNILMTKHEITGSIFKFYSQIDNNITFQSLLDKLWSHQFNPLDPESGWGTRNHKAVYPLKGKNANIVPFNSIGYKLDSSCDADTWRQNAYSYSKIVEIVIQKPSKISASVYCFVSEDFNGTWVKLNSEGASGNESDFYDLNRKGVWQKLEINPKVKKGIVPIYLYFAKYGDIDFCSLDGYVIFAYPSYNYSPINNIVSDSIISNLPFVDFSKNRKKIYNRPHLKPSYQVSSLHFGFTAFLHLKPIEAKIDADPIRYWFKKVFNEDTTYFSYNSDIRIPNIHPNGIEDRTNRWRFSIEIFTNEYNWRKKLFGGGFDYLNWYGHYFYNNRTKADWPHNPFLSVLLYSGILGLLVYLYFMYKVFYYYIKYRKEYGIFFIFFLITFFFSFFSANSPFDPPVMGFFVLLPFFIHYIHSKKDNESMNKIEQSELES